MALVLVTTACSEAPDARDADPGGGAPPDSITVTFTRAEAPVTVRRALPAGSDPVRGALDWLVRGPTGAEGDEGVESWFSGETAGSVRSVGLDDSGRLVVDFNDLSNLIPGASSSTGSQLLLQELNGTVFTFPEVESVEYRMEGSCTRFWEWLQYDCQPVTRPPS